MSCPLLSTPTEAYSLLVFDLKSTSLSLSLSFIKHITVTGFHKAYYCFSCNELWEEHWPAAPGDLQELVVCEIDLLTTLVIPD